MAIMLGGLFGLFSAVDVHAGAARLVARLGAASTTATLALYGVVLAVDGVALKQAVNAWAHSEAKREILVAPCAPLKPSHPLGGGETRCLLRLRGMGCSRRPSCGRR